jgi:hypothetical protein
MKSPIPKERLRVSGLLTELGVSARPSRKARRLAQWRPVQGLGSAVTGVFGSERLTGALLDRLTHHVHILQMNGESYRLNQSKNRSRRASSETPVDDPT